MNRKIAVSNSEDNFAVREYPKLSLVIPLHNEEKILEQQTLKLIKHVQQLVERLEILFVENGSVDNTLRIIEKLQKRFDFIRSIRMKKADYSTAVIEGIKNAKGEYSIVIGIDYVDIKVLDRCLHALENSDVVICSKNKGLDKRPFMNRLANRCYNSLVKLFFKLEYSDTEGYQGYRTRRIQILIADVKTKAHLCNLWVLVKAKRAHLKIDEVPLVVYERRASKFMKFTRLPYLAAISLIEFTKLKCKGY
jgi:glycosyltransferase involved in cell wall biosynthesis